MHVLVQHYADDVTGKDNTKRFREENQGHFQLGVASIVLQN